MALGGPVQAIPHDAVIRPVTVKTPHASTPHTTQTAATKPTPPWLNTAALTQQQIDDQATAEANASIAPQVSGLQSQQATYDAEQKAYQAAMQGFYSALAPYMAGVSSKVSDAYNSAATAMGGIAHGYAGELGANADKNTADTNAALARAGQTQAITAPGNTGALTDAFAATNGGIEGASFAEQGAAKAADAANKPAIWAAQGRDSLTEAINKAVAGDANYAAQIKTVYDTVPALRDTIVKQIQSAEFDKQKLIDDEQNTAFNQKAKVASLNLQTSVAAFDEKYKINSLALKGQALQLQAQKYAQETLNSNRNYALALARVGIADKNLQLRVLAQEYKLANGGFTPTQLNRFNNTARVTVGQINEARAAGQPPNYQAAMSQMATANVPPSIAQKFLAPLYPRQGQQAFSDFNYAAPGGTPYVLPKGVAIGEITAGAKSRGLDPNAVLAVASMEGLGGGVGDNGTSFGPWQLHAGGALPASVAAKGAAFAAQWAWSPPGINYALDSMAKVAKGLTGQAAINAIVRRFERPANPSKEVAGATARYGS